jgi:hypothetical protein
MLGSNAPLQLSVLHGRDMLLVGRRTCCLSKCNQ